MRGSDERTGSLFSCVGVEARLLRAMMLHAFYSVRSERPLIERMEFGLRFRWFVGLGADEPAWDASTFSKNRHRLLQGYVAPRFLATLMAGPKVKRLLSCEHFSVDGPMIQAWASMKSVEPIKRADGDPPACGGRNAEVGCRGTRANATTDRVGWAFTFLAAAYNLVRLPRLSAASP